MSTIYMIRHGQASFGEEDYDVLSKRGYHQSRILAEYLHSIGIRFDLAVTGTLKRQLATADTLFDIYREKGDPVVEVHMMEEFNEYNSRDILTAIIPVILEENPSLEKDVKQIFTHRKSFQRVFEATMLKWVSGDCDHLYIPRYLDFVTGVYRGLDKIMKENGRGKTIAIITSGGPIAATVQRALNLGYRDTMRVTWQIANSSVSRFKCTREHIMMSGFNSYAHLENQPDETLITYR
ncbi:MAG: histidine phosphatase family protein [Spirochaetota bacterium]